MINQSPENLNAAIETWRQEKILADQQNSESTSNELVKKILKEMFNV